MNCLSVAARLRRGLSTGLGAGLGADCCGEADETIEVSKGKLGGVAEGEISGGTLFQPVSGGPEGEDIGSSLGKAAGIPGLADLNERSSVKSLDFPSWYSRLPCRRC